MAKRLGKMVASSLFWRGVASIIVFLVLWEIGSRSKEWMAPEFFAPFKSLLGALGFKKDYLPWIGSVPAPSGVLATGTLTAANLVGPLAGRSIADLVTEIAAGRVYVNLMTDDGLAPSDEKPGDFSSGEMRGQIR